MKYSELANQDIRRRAKESGVRIFELCAPLHISEATLTRRLRYELDERDTARYLAAIDEIAESRAAMA